eukprot:Gb_25358 [translate_table: standard]
MSKRPAEVPGGQNYIELKEQDEETLRVYLRRKSDTHHCNDVLRRAGLKEFFLMPNLAYDVSLVAEVVRLIAPHPSALEITDQAIHEVIGLPFDAPEVLDGPKQQHKVIVEQYCKQSIDFTSSGIRVEGLRDKNIRRIAKLMAIKLFCLQRYTHFLTHLMRAIVGVAEGKKYNWCTFVRNQMQTLLKKRTELRYVENVEDRRRKKGKYKVEEDAPRNTPEEPPQSSTEQAGTSGVNQVPIPLLPNYLTNILRLEWPGNIPDNFIHLEYDDRWKVFEEGLDKDECELFNHEQWRPTFTANVINILVRDLVRKIKDPEYGISNETKRAQEQAFKAEQKIKFIERFCDTWLENISSEDTAYK